MYGDFHSSVFAFATVTRKSFNGKFTAKKLFSHRTFYVTITDTDTGSVKSLHTLFDKYSNHMLVKFEQNYMIRNKPNFELFDKNG